MDEIDLVVLDMAGTTIEDRGEVPAAFDVALREAGIAVTDADVRAVRGISKRDAIQRLVQQRYGPDDPANPTRVAAAYAAFRRHLQAQYATCGVRFLPGARETIVWLRERGLRVALNTGFDRSIVETILKHLDWQGAEVDAVVCGDDVPQGRPAPFMIFRAMERAGVISVHRVMVVGDTVRDLEAGYHAGVRYNVGVLSGAHDAAQLAQANPTHLVPSVAGLPGLWG